jgi:hypothetical protein
MTEQTATQTPAPKDTLKPCACSLFEVGEFDAEKDGAEFTTGCDRQTKSLFAQGHDAKLVGFLVRGHLDGYEIRTVQGGMSITFGGPVEAAANVSEALSRKAKGMLDVAAKKAEQKAEREKAREAKKAAAAKAQQTETTEAKPADAPKTTKRPRRPAKTAA